MGSYIELNDTLQITTEQGFPEEFSLGQHVAIPFNVDTYRDRVFEFHDKPNIRIFHSPPTRVFWAHNIDNRWLYWGLVEILELNLDLVNITTAGKYRIIKIFTLAEMKPAEHILRPPAESTYFNESS